MDFIKLFFKGIIVGVANVIPGVSGGTIAVVLHIFDRMIDAINHFTKDIKKHIMFLLPLLEGAGFGVDTNILTLISRTGTKELPLQSKESAANSILDEALVL